MVNSFWQDIFWEIKKVIRKRLNSEFWNFQIANVPCSLLQIIPVTNFSFSLFPLFHFFIIVSHKIKITSFSKPHMISEELDFTSYNMNLITGIFIKIIVKCRQKNHSKILSNIVIYWLVGINYGLLTTTYFGYSELLNEKSCCK